jgi:hypothetical protein
VYQEGCTALRINRPRLPLTSSASSSPPGNDGIFSAALSPNAPLEHALRAPAGVADSTPLPLANPAIPGANPLDGTAAAASSPAVSARRHMKVRGCAEAPCAAIGSEKAIDLDLTFFFASLLGPAVLGPGPPFTLQS